MVFYAPKNPTQACSAADMWIIDNHERNVNTVLACPAMWPVSVSLMGYIKKR